MFKSLFFLLGFVLVSFFSTSALAGNNTPVCKAEDKALVKNLTEKYGVFTLDFTNSSRDCLEDFTGGVSHKYLVYVAESDSPAWRNATVEAAKIDKQEGIPVFVAFAKDRDGDPRTADTFIWANGIERYMVPERVKEGYTIEMVVAVDPETSINEIHKTGHTTYSRHLYVPPH